MDGDPRPVGVVDTDRLVVVVVTDSLLLVARLRVNPVEWVDRPATASRLPVVAMRRRTRTVRPKAALPG